MITEHYRLTFISLIFFTSAFGQSPTYHTDIEPLIRAHCVRCHDGSGYAPFPLTDYAHVAKRGAFMLQVMENRIMPPWPADPNYRSFQNQNILSEQELEIFREWLNIGMPQGSESGTAKPDNAPSVPLADSIWSFGMHRAYMVPNSFSDSFKRFHIPANIHRDIHVSRYEFKPGNLAVLHHNEFFVDTTGALNVLFDQDSAYGSNSSGYEARDSTFRHYTYTTGWLPGERFEDYPEGVYGVIPKGSNFMLLNHYGPYPLSVPDSSGILIHEKQCADCRRFSTFSLHGHRHLVNGLFRIPADSVVTLHSKRIISDTVSVFALLAHAHHLAVEMTAYAVTPDKDTIPLLRIPRWDFNWQFIYKLAEYVVLPKATVVHFLVTYDNTQWNPENPHNPAKDVRYSFDADQEMMELFLFNIPFQKGDHDTTIRYRHSVY
jgi:hypothetical protein